MKTSQYPPKSLVKLTETKVYAVTFVDGNHNIDTRLVAVIGGNVHFLHQEGVDATLRQPAQWLKDKILAETGTVITKAVPTDDVSALPIGSES